MFMGSLGKRNLQDHIGAKDTHFTNQPGGPMFAWMA